MSYRAVATERNDFGGPGPAYVWWYDLGPTAFDYEAKSKTRLHTAGRAVKCSKYLKAAVVKTAYVVATETIAQIPNGTVEYYRDQWIQAITRAIARINTGMAAVGGGIFSGTEGDGTGRPIGAFPARWVCGADGTLFYDGYMFGQYESIPGNGYPLWSGYHVGFSFLSVTVTASFRRYSYRLASANYLLISGQVQFGPSSLVGDSFFGSIDIEPPGVLEEGLAEGGFTASLTPELMFYIPSDFDPLYPEGYLGPHVWPVFGKTSNQYFETYQF